MDWLIEGKGGYLETNPSTSPEHMFIAPDGKPASVSYSTTMDMSIIKEVFIAIVSASEVNNKLIIHITNSLYFVSFENNKKENLKINRFWVKKKVI